MIPAYLVHKENTNKHFAVLLQGDACGNTGLSFCYESLKSRKSQSTEKQTPDENV